MRTHTHHFGGWLAVVLAAAAVAVPAAHAGGPDDRATYRGMSPGLAPGSQSPDDRGFYRGASVSLAPTALAPDDRSFARSMHVVEPTPAAAGSVGFDWGDALVGAAFALTVALLGAASILLAQRPRSMLRTA